MAVVVTERPVDFFPGRPCARARFRCAMIKPCIVAHPGVRRTRVYTVNSNIGRFLDEAFFFLPSRSAWLWLPRRPASHFTGQRGVIFVQKRASQWNLWGIIRAFF